MRAQVLAITAALVAQLGAGPAFAQQSLADLLKKVQNTRVEEQRINREREEEFRKNRDKQASLMAEAVAKRNRAEAESQSLSAQYDTNELRINELNDLLLQRQGNLGELFGVTRQIAGEAANALQDSMISSQFPSVTGNEGRVDFLRRIADSKSLPSISELERLWFELQREMTESGAVATYNAQVVQPDGPSVEMKVVRVGPFTASSDDQYLNFRDGVLQVLPRQPSGHMTGLAEDLAEATGDEYVTAVADPARGVLLSLVTERPSWFDRIWEAEIVVWVIVVVGVLGAAVGLYQMVWLIGERGKVRQQLAHVDAPSKNNSLGRVLEAFRGDPSRIEEDAEVAELRISEAVLREVPRLERFQAFLRLAVAAGPLLGLVGTVVGMIITFQSITESGQSDPRLMANGIGQAMIATVMGLGIAIPLLFLNAFLASMSRNVVQVLDEQSTGLLAESIEKRRA